MSNKQLHLHRATGDSRAAYMGARHRMRKQATAAAACPRAYDRTCKGAVPYFRPSQDSFKVMHVWRCIVRMGEVDDTPCCGRACHPLLGASTSEAQRTA
jgi:hypothetical protein